MDKKICISAEEISADLNPNLHYLIHTVFVYTLSSLR